MNHGTDVTCQSPAKNKGSKMSALQKLESLAVRIFNRGPRGPAAEGDAGPQGVELVIESEHLAAWNEEMKEFLAKAKEDFLKKWEIPAQFLNESVTSEVLEPLWLSQSENAFYPALPHTKMIESFYLATQAHFLILDY